MLFAIYYIFTHINHNFFYILCFLQTSMSVPVAHVEMVVHVMTESIDTHVPADLDTLDITVREVRGDTFLI